MSGPFLGSFIYGFVGYSGTFYSFAGMLLLTFLIASVYYPQQLNYDIKKSSEGEVSESPEGYNLL